MMQLYMIVTIFSLNKRTHMLNYTDFTVHMINIKFQFIKLKKREI